MSKIRSNIPSNIINAIFDDGKTVKNKTRLATINLITNKILAKINSLHNQAPLSFDTLNRIIVNCLEGKNNGELSLLKLYEELFLVNVAGETYFEPKKQKLNISELRSILKDIDMQKIRLIDDDHLNKDKYDVITSNILSSLQNNIGIKGLSRNEPLPAKRLQNPWTVLKH